jgi:acetyl-CoA/propionyl-CoA carboxylase biotin carboxyl carrier protein
VEERLDLSGVSSQVTPTEPPAAGLVEKTTTVEVNGKRFEVKAWVPESGGAAPVARRAPRAAAASSAGAGGGNVAAPMQGTIVKVLVEVGQEVKVGDPVVVLEAMKMENQLQAEKAGTVKSVNVKPGDKVGSGDVLVVIA